MVVSAKTGEVLDDAQGYGYLTYENACKAFSFKLMWGDDYKEKGKIEKRIEKWLATNQHFVCVLNMMVRQVDGCKWGQYDDFFVELVKRMLMKRKIKINFNVKDLIRVWQKVYW